jgi:hypothetical protein
MPTKTIICTIPARYWPIPTLMAAALLWRGSRIESLPAMAATAMRVGAGGALVATALSLAAYVALPTLEIEISRISKSHD